MNFKEAQIRFEQVVKEIAGTPESQFFEEIYSSFKKNEAWFSRSGRRRMTVPHTEINATKFGMFLHKFGFVVTLDYYWAFRPAALHSILLTIENEAPAVCSKS